MDKETIFEENHAGAQALMNESNADAGDSSQSGYSWAFSRSNSEVSSLSELNDDSSSIDDGFPLGCPVAKSVKRSQAILTRLGMKQHNNVPDAKCDEKSVNSDVEMMKAIFSRLLLGGEMSGTGKGVCSALAISNDITNLYGKVFGEFRRLEPLPPESKSMWKREMDCLLAVCDYMIVLGTGTRNFPDIGTQEVLTSGPRPDICMNLPALQKLDAMLLDILESFDEKEFWYVEEGNISCNLNSSRSFPRAVHQKEDKWWFPVPCTPSSGLSGKSRKQLQRKRECAIQIRKAAMVINNTILDEIEVPHTYLATLPKSGRACIGDAVHQYMSTTNKFSPEHLLDYLNIKTEHETNEVADQIEASMHIWKQKACLYNAKSSWQMVKNLKNEEDKNVKLGSRAESLLSYLKQKYPALQTTLDKSKIKNNKDVGHAVLESYSRVLESLAFKIVELIDDVIHVDKSVKHCNKENPH